jgi:hypothetical protein
MDDGVLLSALATPEATFDGVYLHADEFTMAAAYAFHIAEARFQVSHTSTVPCGRSKLWGGPRQPCRHVDRVTSFKKRPWKSKLSHCSSLPERAACRRHLHRLYRLVR